MTEKTMHFIEQVKTAKQLVFYGAQVYTYSLYAALKIQLDFCVFCFAVTDTNNNPNAIDGIEVKALSDLPDSLRNSLVVIAIPKPYHDEVVGYLSQKGFSNWIAVTADVHSEIMDEYWKKTDPSYCRLFDLSVSESNDAGTTMEIYVACNINDKELKESYEHKEPFRVIQSGAALTDKRISDIADNVGENISKRNMNYSEISATYWLWKNSDAEYVGLNHYRRILRLPENTAGILSHNNFDGILPTPVLVYPNADAHHAWYIKKDDWDCAMTVFRDMYPDDYLKAREFFSGQKFYLHNIWVLRRNHADAFCEWLFNLLFEIEKRTMYCGDSRTDRYLGYIAENLTALYFNIRKRHLKIAHTDEMWLR